MQPGDRGMMGMHTDLYGIAPSGFNVAASSRHVLLMKRCSRHAYIIMLPGSNII
jgi:hypothetical protein